MCGGNKAAEDEAEEREDGGGGDDGPSPLETPPETTAASTEESTLCWPESKDLWQQWTYSYMRRILDRSAAAATTRTHMTFDDIYAAPPSLQSRHLGRAFWEEYRNQRTRQQQQTPQDENASQKALMGTLWKLAAPTFVPAGACQLISILAQVAVPLLVCRLLQRIEAHPDRPVPWGPSFGILGTLLVYGFFHHRQRHLSLLAGITLRATVLAVSYQRVLTLTPRGRRDLTAGALVNLVAVDTQKLYEVTQELHLLWALPAAVGFVTTALVVITGPVAMCGVTVLVALVPLIRSITATMHRVRRRRVACTDRRVALTHDLLRGVRVCKVNHYEHNYETALGAIRREEMKLLERETAVWATTLSVSKLSAAFAAAATFTAHVLLRRGILTAAESFAVFLLFAALRFPINYAGRLIGRLAQARSSVERLAQFLDRPARDDGGVVVTAEDDRSSDRTHHVQPLVVKKASFVIGDSLHNTAEDTLDGSAEENPQEPRRQPSPPVVDRGSPSAPVFVVSGFDFQVHRGQVLACCGPVGSGKSTLIAGLTGEASPASPETTVATAGSLAVVPQTPFILNDTVRENILFGRSYDASVYNQVIQACCLGPDLDNLGPTRDFTEIGERGVTLSGGQKQRISLARAAYGKPDLVLLDDPLSALDAGTGKLVFQNLIKGPDAFFRDSAILLVTHASHFLNRVDQIAILVEGENKFLGTWQDLLTFEPNDVPTQKAVEHIRRSIQDEHGEDEEDDAKYSEGNVEESDQKYALMTVEERERGISSWSTWLLWFKHAGGLYFVCILVMLLTLDRLLYFAQEYWVARWTDGAEQPIDFFGITFDPQTDGLSAQYQFLTAYAIILAMALFANLARSEWSVTGGTRAARNVYQAMLVRVLGAPLSYFETTPMGRLLNRFTYDMEIVDFVLSQNMSLLLVATSSYISGISVMVGIVPLVALSAIPVTVIYVFLLWYYRRTGTDLQRLDALSRSPIQAMMSEGMDGFSTIRILKRESVFLAKYHRVVDRNTAALLNFVSAQRWLGCRIEIMGAFTVFIPAFLVSAWNDHLKLSSGLAGLLIVGSLNFTLALSFLVDYFAETESAITAIERVDAMSKVPQEKTNKTDPNMAPDPSWPLSGSLKFENVCMRYRPGLPFALNGLSFEIPPGKSCGVVGRTGAGKSSLTVALFRLVEIESGRILLDGVDLGKLGLSDVRGRANSMSIIPQDPFLAGSTLRESLDPFGQSSDEAILDALEAVRLRQSDSVNLQSSFELNTAIQEGGSNLSVGERQLLNLARALLSQPKVLVLDEATASIDGATDALIQHMLRTRFPGTTLLTVAHRLDTIMDNDYVLVMQNGHAAEFGTPYDLLQRPDGLFVELVDATGAKSASALRAMARQKTNTAVGARLC